MSETVANKPRHDAFVSYSHAADGRLAPALQSALERFAKPWYRRRALAVFRDQSNLSANPALWPTIAQALDEAEYLLLLASPEAAKSKWVRREIEHWLGKESTRQASDKHLIIVLTDGDLAWDGEARDFDWDRSTALPRTIAGAFPEEPLYVDLRWARDEQQLSLEHAKFRDCVADLAAPLHGVAKDEIAGEAVRQHRRTMRLAWSGVTALTILLVVAVAAAVVAILNRRTAIEQRDIALIGQSRFLAALSRRETEAGNAVNGMLLALEGLPDVRRGVVRPYVAEAESALYESRSVPSELSLLAGHEDVVWRAAISNDGTRVATASWDHTARVWNARTSRPVARLVGHSGPVRTVDFSPDGRRLVTASNDGTARLWDAQSGQQLATLPHGALVSKALYNRAGTLIVTTSYDHITRVWEATTGELRVSLLGHWGNVTDAVISPDGKTVATIAADLSVRLWDLASGAERMPLLGHEAAITSVAFSADGSRILTSSEDNTARLWSTETGDELRVFSDGIQSVGRGLDGAAFSPDGALVVTSVYDVLQTPTERLTLVWDGRSGERQFVLGGRFLAFSPQGDLLVTTSNSQIQEVLDLERSLAREERYAKLWDVASGQAVATLAGHAGAITDAVFSTDGQVLVTASRDGTARLWDVRNRLGYTALPCGPHFVREIRFSPDGARVMCRTATGIRVCDVQTGDVVTSIDVHEAGQDLASDATYDRDAIQLEMVREHILTSATFAADGSRILTTSSLDPAQLWDTETGTPVAAFEPTSDWTWGGRISPAGDRVVTGGADGVVRVFDVESRALISAFDAAGRGELRAAAFSPDGRRVAFVAASGLIEVLDVAQAAVAASFSIAPQDEAPSLLAFSADGRQLATSLRDGRVLIWDVDAGELRAELQGHGGEVVTAAFDASGTRLATGSDDRTLRLWDTRSGAALAVLEGHSNRVTGVVFGANGERLISAARDGSARLWDARSGTGLAVFRHTSEPKPNQMNALAFAPDQSVVATATTTFVRLWPVFATTQTLVDNTKETVPRCLSPAQRSAFFLDPQPPAWCFELGKLEAAIADHQGG